ncbi:hypothetical protein Hanom_Chr07g00594811 [Helianthus anomalus]
MTNKDIVYNRERIQTKYRHKCTNKLPLGCSFVFIFNGCRFVSILIIVDLQVFKTLMSFLVFNVGGSSKSSRLESRECINKLPVSCRRCVDKLPLNISSPLSYAREILYLYEERSLWC